MQESDGSLLCVLGFAGLVVCFMSGNFLNLVPVGLAIWISAYILGKGD